MLLLLDIMRQSIRWDAAVDEDSTPNGAAVVASMDHEDENVAMILPSSTKWVTTNDIDRLQKVPSERNDIVAAVDSSSSDPRWGWMESHHHDLLDGLICCGMDANHGGSNINSSSSSSIGFGLRKVVTDGIWWMTSGRTLAEDEDRESLHEKPRIDSDHDPREDSDGADANAKIDDKTSNNEHDEEEKGMENCKDDGEYKDEEVTEGVGGVAGDDSASWTAPVSLLERPILSFSDASLANDIWVSNTRSITFDPYDDDNFVELGRGEKCKCAILPGCKVM